MSLGLKVFNTLHNMKESARYQNSRVENSIFCFFNFVLTLYLFISWLSNNVSVRSMFLFEVIFINNCIRVYKL